MMRYLVTGDFQPFFTKWFDIENHYEEGMIVYDLAKGLYYDGTDWKTIDTDNL
jgi:hypothetical protein